MSKNKLGDDSPFPKFIHLKIRRRNDVESLTTLEEGEFKLAIDGCISISRAWNFWWKLSIFGDKIQAILLVITT